MYQRDIRRGRRGGDDGGNWRTRLLASLGLIEYWPLTANANGAKNGINGAATAVTFDANGALFDGASSFINLYSAGLAAAFSGPAGTAMLQAKVANAGVWADGVERYLLRLYVDGNNSIAFVKSAAANTFFGAYKAGGVTEQINDVSVPTGYFTPWITWDKNAGVDGEVKMYFGNTQTGLTQTTLGVWAGALVDVRTCIGAAITTPGNIHNGWIRNCALWNRAIPLTEMTKYLPPF